MYEVHIFIWHAFEYASTVLSTSYTDQINDSLQRIPSRHGSHPHFVLRQKLKGSTPLSSLRSIIVEETGISRSVQSYFRTEGRGEPWMDPLRDDVDLNYIRALLEDDDENDRIYLCLTTTAHTLRDNFELRPERGDGMVQSVLNWRHNVGGLRYLRHTKGKAKVVTDGGEADPDKLAENYERMERASAETVRRKFSDWDRLVRGVEQPRTATEPDETVEAREQDIETRFRQYLLQKKEMLAKLSANNTTANIDGTALSDKQTSSNHRVYSGHLMPGLDSIRDVERRLEFDFPPAREKIVVKPLRTSSGNLSPDSSSFTIRSGVLLWGQLHTVFAGSISSTLQQNAQSVPQQLPGGTIKQYQMTYRSAARNGEWKVRKAFDTPPWCSEEQPTAQFGWIIYHEAIDPLAAIDRCSRVGISNGNTHVDKVNPFLHPSIFQHEPFRIISPTIIPFFFTLPIGLQIRTQSMVE